MIRFLTVKMKVIYLVFSYLEYNQKEDQKGAAKSLSYTVRVNINIQGRHR